MNRWRALDAKLREEMQHELIDLQREVGITFVFVTHAQDEALALSHRIAVMNRGRIEQFDEPSKIYGFPQNRFVADFIGNTNMLEVDVTAATPTRLRLAVAGLGEIVAPPREGVRAGQKAGSRAARTGAHRGHLDGELENHYSGKVRSFIYRRQRHHLHGRTGERHPGRGAAVQLGAGPRPLLRGRRRGHRGLAARCGRISP